MLCRRPGTAEGIIVCETIISKQLAERMYGGNWRALPLRIQVGLIFQQVKLTEAPGSDDMECLKAETCKYCTVISETNEFL
jgi:hypothetical protein